MKDTSHHGVYSAPWEKTLDRLLTPLEIFIRRQTTSGIMLMFCAVLAMAIANTQWYEPYNRLLQTPISLGIGEKYFSLSLKLWVNEALMAVFFFIIGLELKRELTVGELTHINQALLPLIAALGGMIAPALIYLIFNDSGHTINGWGIPMATDIAFAIGALSLLGNQIPKALITFLIAMAIVDDLGAVLVIALFYTSELHTNSLLFAALFTTLLGTLNVCGVRRTAPYILLSLLLWVALFNSGVHATIAGIILAFTIPIHPKYQPSHFIYQVRSLSQQMKKSLKSEPSIIHNSEMRSQLEAIEEGIHKVQAPAQELEDKLHLPVAYLVIPIFALANACIPVNFENLGDQLFNPVTLGVTFGLVVGKLVGITGFTWLGIKLGIVSLPCSLTMQHIVGIGLLGGIGFTLSIFIAELGFASYPSDLLLAKTGVIVASMISGVSGIFWLSRIKPTECQ